jgi:hypothetical protein
MTKRTQGTAYWSEQNCLWETSGLTQPTFCEQQDLSYKQFVYWRGRLKRKNTLPGKPKLLKVSATPQLSGGKAAPASCLEVILPTGIKLHIKTEADICKASALIQLLSGAR